MSAQADEPQLVDLSKIVVPAGRPWLTLLLVAGFYLLALGLAAGLLLFIYFQWEVLGGINFWIVFACIFGAASILFSIIPRPDRFKAPGPLLTPTDQPEFFALLRSIAQQTGQPLPDRVYLVLDVGASVEQRGGVLSIGSRRIMSIGLPLVSILTVSQLRAVLLHEFGHYYSGDTRLTPYIYQAANAMVRSIEVLSGQNEGINTFFVLYARLFLLQTRAIARRQEFVADQLAANLAGPNTAISTLRLIHGAEPIFDQYWQSEIAPLLDDKKKPPIADGFARFIARPAIAGQMERNLEQEMRSQLADEYDTHPLLAERISALQTLPPGAAPVDDKPAASLLRNVPELERALLAMQFGAKEVAGLEPIDWDIAGTSAYIPQWERELRRQRRALAGVTPRRMPEVVQNLTGFGSKLVPPQGRTAEMGQGELRMYARSILGMGVSLALYRQGWQVEVLPGEAPRLYRDAESVYPFALAEHLVGGLISTEEWLRSIEAWGIADVEFGTL